jgi:outer membrane scaffolding protein for murein synthesis (MipA/OmpV family)
MKLLLVLAVVLLSWRVHAEENPVLLGAGLRSRPEYDGSNARRTDVVPVLRYYGQPWFARTTQGMLEAGLRSELAPQFWAGAQLAYEAGREPDLGPGVSAGLYLEWDRRFGPMPVTFLIRARQNLDADRGGQADLRVTAGVFERGRVQAGIFGQATWGSEAAVRSLYGPPDSGLLHVSGGVLGSFDLGRHWIAVASLELRSLRDPAERSALVERKSARYAAAGIAYRF